MGSLSLETAGSAVDQDSQNLSPFEMVKIGEKFVCFHYIAFIQNVLAHMRTMTISMIALFLAVCFSLSFYPFVPRTEITVWLIVDWKLIAGGVVYVYAGMERDETLSHIANTKPGQSGGEFWIKTAASLTGPLIGILTTQFPSMTDSILGWLQPEASRTALIDTENGWSVWEPY